MSKSLGNRLYSLRCSNGYSLVYVANYINVKTEEYKLVEKDKATLSNDQLYDLCTLYHVDDIYS